MTLIIRKLQQYGIDPKLGSAAILMLLVALIVWLMMSTVKQVEPKTNEKVSVPIDVWRAHMQPVELAVRSQGTVAPRTQTELVAEISGVVTWLSPQWVAGGRFSAGEELLRIDASDYRSALQRSEASVTKTDAQLKRANSELTRVSSLHKRKLASNAELDNADSDYQVALANAADAKAALSQAKNDVRRTRITAPYDGFVRQKLIDKGQYVSRGNTLGSVYSNDFLEVRLPLADSELEFLEQANIGVNGEYKPAVLLSAQYAGRQKHWRGVIDRLEASIDTQSRMVFAVARVPGGSDQAPPVGLFVKASIAGQKLESALLIPRVALRDNENVLVVNEDNILEQRSVDILRIRGDELIIRSGLVDGDLVSTSLSPTIAAGSSVAPVISNSSPALTLDAPTLDAPAPEPAVPVTDADNASL
ncbi:MAG: efflux RND transporter periplasmic adaptor subunit [Pseudomonadales bacterium]